MEKPPFLVSAKITKKEIFLHALLLFKHQIPQLWDEANPFSSKTAA
jgi:hypothetical protein